MNELLPIIRRKRRPLLPVESLPDLHPPPPVETNNTDATQPTQAGETVESDAKGGEHDEAS